MQVLSREGRRGTTHPECVRCRKSMKDTRISELTVSELQALIRETVHEAVAEVLIEFHAIAEAEEQLRMEAELTDYLRTTLQGQSYGETFVSHLDD